MLTVELSASFTSSPNVGLDVSAGAELPPVLPVPRPRTIVAETLPEGFSSKKTFTRRAKNMALAYCIVSNPADRDDGSRTDNYGCFHYLVGNGLPAFQSLRSFCHMAIITTFATMEIPAMMPKVYAAVFTFIFLVVK